MRRSSVAALFLVLVFSCAREPASAVFQPTLSAGELLARQRYGGDIIVFISDGSAACRRARSQVFGPTQIGQFISSNFAAVEVSSRSEVAREVLTRYRAPDSRPRIIVASSRLNDLSIQVVRLDNINERRFLQQLKAIKQAKTIEDFRRSVHR